MQKYTAPGASRVRYIGSWSGRLTGNSGRNLNPEEIIVASFDENSGDQIPPVNQSSTSSGAPAPAKSGSSAVKIILIILAIVVGLGVLGVIGSVLVVRHYVHKFVNNGPNGQMTLSTPEGNVNLNPTESYSASDLGTDIYPGAKSVKGGMRMELPTGSMVTGVFVTSDSKDQVVAFYKAKFGSAASTFDTNDGAILTLPIGDKESVMVTITGKPSENEGKTKIVIVHTKNRKAS
jgi:hypothetical protein